MSPAVWQVRPRRARWVAFGAAVLLLGVFSANAVVLPQTSGMDLRTSDQVAMGLIGALLAGAALLFARPRVRADARGVQVRNLVATRWLGWDGIVAVSFPDGAPWARLELGDDEFVAVMAIQAADGEHAVHAVTQLRGLHAEHGRSRSGRRP